MNRDADLFADALALPPAERAGFLDRMCAGDPAQRARIEHLLSGHDEAEQFMEAPIAPREMIREEKPGDRIGRYKLLQRIGEGGCGVVYMAEQDEPVSRRVALKVIKLGMDTKEVIARFEAERQALALMDHPNIARVFDAGATDSGRPYFVMELVKGVPITRYCDEQNVATRQRLELFTQVCHAIQHAHQKGIIHRDIKPSNILVSLHDDVAVPKVIDFGIAKATHGRLTDHTLFTAFEQFIGTPAYMSPEQAEFNGLDVDTRSDIYSLGVLLYELLTGRPPFDPRTLVSAGLDEIRRVIREVDPPRPSTRLSTLGNADRITIARQRATAPAQLSSQLRGDLDWIVMMTLEKNRARRYETANALALDILRHLHDEPVTARPPSAVYRFRKFVRRNKVGFAATSAILVVLVLGLAVAMWRYELEKAARTAEAAARELAQQRQSELEAINRFLVADILGSASPEVARGRDITLQEVLNNAAARIPATLAGNPLLEASVRHTLGSTYVAIGADSMAEPHLEFAFTTRRQRLGEEHPDTLRSSRTLGLMRKNQQRWQEAETILRRSVELHRRVLGPEHEDTIAATNVLAQVLMWWGKTSTRKREEARELVNQNLVHARKAFGPDHRLTVSTSYYACGVDIVAGRYAESLQRSEEVWRAHQRVFGADHPDTLAAQHDYGFCLRGVGRLTESEQVLRDGLEILQRVHSAEHFGAVRLRVQLAITIRRQGRKAEAEKVIHDGLTQARNAGGATALGHFALVEDLNEWFKEEKRFAESLALLRDWEAVVRMPTAAARDALYLWFTLTTTTLMDLARATEAESLLREFVALTAEQTPDQHHQFDAQRRLGMSLLAQGKVAEAETWIATAYDGWRPRLGATPVRYRAGFFEMMDAIVDANAQLAHTEKARLWSARRTEEVSAAAADSDNWSMLSARATAAGTAKRFPEAIALRSMLLAAAEKNQGLVEPGTLQFAQNLAIAYANAKKPAEAEQLLRRKIAECERSLPDSWWRFDLMRQLAGVLLTEGRIAEADVVASAAYEGLSARQDQIPAARRPVALKSITGIRATAYEKSGNTAAASDWKRKLAAFDPPPRTNIYDESADGEKLIAEALAKAKREGKRVLLQFGANWCTWCHKLHRLFVNDEGIAAFLKRDFVPVMIDVNKGHNQAIDEKFGHPTKLGLPVLVVLDADGTPLVTQETGSLEAGDVHSPQKVMMFLRRWAPAREPLR